MFLSRYKKNNVYPCKPQFYYVKVGFKGINIKKACFHDILSVLNYCIEKLVYVFCIDPLVSQG